MSGGMTKKELQAQYKERKVAGGVIVIKNTHTGKMLIEGTTDLQGNKNRFDFAQKTGSCIHPKLQAEWAGLGSSAFVYEVLEEIEKGETQTSAEFKEDVDLLKEIWMEKLSDKEFY